MDIHQLRTKINELDDEIIELLEKRMRVSKDIGEYKGQNQLPIFDQQRENQILKEVVGKVKDQQISPYIQSIYQSLMDASKAYQQKIQNKQTLIGYQGTKGSYSQAAVFSLFGEGVHTQPIESFEKVFEAVKSQKIDQGVIPVENSSTGGLNDVFDLLREYDLYITGETKVRIDHCLLGTKEATLETIQQVYSHPQALMQCSHFLKQHPNIQAHEYANTAIAAQDVKKWEDNRKSAIASKRAADIWGLKILATDIQDWDQNRTRFLSIGRENIQDGSSNKTSILFTTKHVPGALYKILQPFYQNQLNISKIESRPNRSKQFEYFFYLDIEEGSHNEKLKKALDEVQYYCGYFRILGSYTTKEAL